MRDVRRGNAHAYLHLLQRFLVACDDFGDDVGRLLLDATTFFLELLETIFYQLNELLVIQATGGGDHKILRGEALTIKFEYGFLLQTAHSLVRTQNRLAERMILEKVLCE